MRVREFYVWTKTALSDDFYCDVDISEREPWCVQSVGSGVGYYDAPFPEFRRGTIWCYYDVNILPSLAHFVLSVLVAVRRTLPQ